MLMNIMALAATSAATDALKETAEAAVKETTYWNNPDIWQKGFNVTDPERWKLALTVTVVGMLMIFAVLGILWLVLTLSKFIFAGASAQKKDEQPASKAVKTESVAPKATIAPVAPAAADDAQLVAVITAAVAAYRASEDPDAAHTGFRVVSYRRANGGRAWNSK